MSLWNLLFLVVFIALCHSPAKAEKLCSAKFTTGKTFGKPIATVDYTMTPLDGGCDEDIFETLVPLDGATNSAELTVLRHGNEKFYNDEGKSVMQCLSFSDWDIKKSKTHNQQQLTIDLSASTLAEKAIKESVKQMRRSSGSSPLIRLKSIGHQSVESVEAEGKVRILVLDASKEFWLTAVYRDEKHRDYRGVLYTYRNIQDTVVRLKVDDNDFQRLDVTQKWKAFVRRVVNASGCGDIILLHSTSSNADNCFKKESREKLLLAAEFFFHQAAVELEKLSWKFEPLISAAVE